MTAKVVDTMMQMGMNRSVATLAIPYMWSTPAITDRYSTQTMSIVKALQGHLGMPQTGQVTPELDACLKRMVSPSWVTCNWIDIYRRVLQGVKTMYTNESRAGGEYVPTGGWLTDIFSLHPPQETWVIGDTIAKLTGGGLTAESANTSEPWCSVSHPVGNCTPIKGVVKAATPAMLAIFNSIQQTANRIAQVKGYAKIGVDGRLGSKTAALVNKCLDSSYTPDSMAATASFVLTQLNTLAYTLNAPLSVSSPAPSSPPSRPAPGGGVLNPTKPPSFLDEAVSMALSPIGLLAIGFGIWQYTQKPKGKSRKSSWF